MDLIGRSVDGRNYIAMNVWPFVLPFVGCFHLIVLKRREKS
jgi:hypothetical protein